MLSERALFITLIAYFQVIVQSDNGIGEFLADAAWLRLLWGYQTDDSPKGQLYTRFVMFCY